jgi:hypothetical protein
MKPIPITIHHERVAAIIRSIRQEKPIQVDSFEDAGNLAAAALGILARYCFTLNEESDAGFALYESNEWRKFVTLLETIGSVEMNLQERSAALDAISPDQSDELQSRKEFATEMRTTLESMAPGLYEHRRISIVVTGGQFRITPEIEREV